MKSTRRRVAFRNSRSMLGGWVRSWFTLARRAKEALQADAVGHRHAIFEFLEDRRLLSVFAVTGTGDDHLASGSMFANPVPGEANTYTLPSLRAAVEAANANPGADTIVFEPTLAGQTITLANGPLTLADSSGPTTITGLGASQLTVDGNVASTVFVVNSSVSVVISGLTIAHGNAVNNFGGGIDNEGTLTLANCAVSRNSAGYNGGGVYNNGNLTVTNSTLSGNSSRAGGGICSYGTLAVTGSTLSQNSGGAICDFSGTLTLTGSTLSGNSVSGDGGGVCNDNCTLTITSTTFSGNSASDDGGAIFNLGSLTLTSSTLSGNSAANDGGGILNGMGVEPMTAGALYGGVAAQVADAVTVTDSTLSGNSASYGGGIDNSASLTVTDSTLTGNVATLQGGGLLNTGTTAIANSIVASDTAPNSPDVMGPVTANFSLIQNTAGASITGGSDITGQSALLGALGNYSGPTQTVPLLPGSPAIDAGSNSWIASGVTTDQRGLPRIVHNIVDMGAFEYQPLVTCIGPAAGLPVGGTVVVITGVDLTGATAVNFGSTAAANIVVNSATQITATSPASAAGTVDVTVLTPMGTSATSSADQFTYGVSTTTSLSTSQASVVYGTPVTFTATVIAGSGGIAPGLGSVDFFDTATGVDLGLGAFGSSVGMDSTWTLATGVKTFNATLGDTITATYAAGTGFVGSSGTTTETVGAFPITVTAAASTKVYDGTTTAAAVPTITSGSLVAGDVTAFTESYDNANPGTGHTLTPVGSVVDGDGGDNYAVTFAVNTAGVIMPGVATTTTVSTSQPSAVYGTAVTLTASVTAAGGTTAPSQGSVDFLDTTTGNNLGNGTLFGSSGLTATWTLLTGVKAFQVTGGDDISAIYTAGTGFGGSSGATLQAVTARPITVTAATATKVYDGTTWTNAAPTVTSGSLVTGDMTAFTETYNTKNVGTGETLTAAGSVADGNGGCNYAVTLVADTTGQITARPITVTAVATTKTYDGTTSSAASPAVTSASVVTTLAGSLPTGSSDGSGSTARFDNPQGVAVDSAGNVYVADSFNDEIRKITPTGVVTTLAGSAGQAGSSNGTGSAAGFNDPQGVAVDSAGNVYVADSFNDEIRKITPAGVVTTLAGSAGNEGAINGTGSAASFDGPVGVAVDNAGNVYVTEWDNGDVRKITPSGKVSTLAGSIPYPWGVAVDNAGNIYVAEVWNGIILKITPSGVVNTLAGSAGKVGSSDGTGTAAFFQNPSGVAVDSAGNVYVGDSYNDEIRKITPAGVVSTLAGAAGQWGSNDGTGNAARFAHPEGVAVDIAGNVYVGDLYSNEIRLVSGNTALVTGDAAAFTETFDTPAVGSGKTLMPAGSVNDGNGGANYSVTFVVNTTGMINPAAGVNTSTTVTTSLASVVYGTPVTFIATVTAGSGSTAPTAGSVDFFDTTTSTDLGLGTFGSSEGTTSTWTFATGVKTFNVTAGDTITATYAAGTGFIGSSGATTQTVTALPITVTATACGKIYDGTTAAAPTPTVTGGSLVTGDVAAWSESYGSKNVGPGANGSGCTLIPTGSINDGNGGNNYSVTYVDNTNGQISPRVISVTAATNTKIYDGTTSAAATPAISLGSLAPGDTAAFYETYNSSSVGTGLTLTPAGSVNDGNGGVDYSVTFVANATGVINPATGASTSTTVATSLASVVYGTAVTFTATVSASSGSTAPTAGSVDFFDTTTNTDLGLGTFGGSTGTASTWSLTTGVKTFNVTTGDAITATYVAGTGFGNSSGTVLQTVTARPITVTAAANSKVYDGTTNASAVPTITSGSLVPGDTAAFSESYLSKNVGSGLSLVPAGSVNDGNGGSNYSVTCVNSTTGQTTPRTLVLEAVTSTKAYDGNTSVTAIPTLVYGSLAPGDTATFYETYDNSLPGTGKTLTPYASINDGNGGNNYVVAGIINSTGVITPALTMTQFLISAPPTAPWGSNIIIGVTAATANDQTVTSYGGTVTLSFRDTSQPVLPPHSVQFTMASGSGYCLVSLPAAGVWDLTVTDGTYYGYATITVPPVTVMSHFLVTTSPSPADIAAGGSVIVFVTAEDSSGDTVTSYSGTVTLGSVNATTGLQGASAGAAITLTSGFGYGLGTLTTAGAWDITATDGTYSGTATTPIVVTPAAASQVVFDPNHTPTSTSAGATMDTAMADVEDPYGNVITTGTGSTANVTVAIASGSGTLLGTTTVTAVGGVASFNDLSIDQAGAYTLMASASGVGGTSTSNSFAITPGAATQLGFLTQPDNTWGTGTMADPVEVAVQDQYGNTVTSDSSQVTISLIAGSGGGNGTLGGPQAETAVDGVATFNGLYVTGAGTGYTLSAADSNSNLTAATSNPFNTSMIVNSVTWNSTGFVATFSDPFDPTAVNLWGSQSSPSVSLYNVTGSAKLVRGSLVFNSTDTQATFVATTLVNNTGLPITSTNPSDLGVLPAGNYAATLYSGSAGFQTTTGQALDGTEDDSYSNYSATDTVSSADTVVLPSFARGPGNTVNVTNDAGSIAAASSTANIATTANNGAKATTTTTNVATAANSGATAVATTTNIAAAANGGASESGTNVTITTTAAHKLVVGEQVTIAGVSVSGYNGTFTVTSVPSTTAFTYTAGASGLATSGGGTVEGTIVTIKTTTAHNLVAGALATVAGVTVGGYNGTFTVLSATSTSFTYSVTPQTLAASGGGTVQGTIVTITTTAASNLAAGQQATIAGVGVSGYNGTFTVLSVPTTTTFTYSVTPQTLAVSGGGTVTSYGVTDSNGVLTVRSTVIDGLVVGEPMTLASVGVSGYNGTYYIASTPGLSVFTVVGATGLATSGGGTWTASTGIPVSLTSADAVKSGQFTVSWDPTLLNVTGVAIDPKLHASYPGSTLTFSTSGEPAGSALITFTSTENPLPNSINPILLGGLIATVPATALYTSKDLLQVTSVSLINASGAVVSSAGSDALHLVAYLGDLDGDAEITPNDNTVLTELVGSGTDQAYRLADPNIIGDLTGDGKADGAAEGYLVDYILSVPSVPEMLANPGLGTIVFAAGPDPTVSIPSALQVGTDGILTVPVNIDDPQPAGSAGMTEATLALTYNPAAFSVTSNDIHLGSVPLAGSGWNLQSVVDAATGEIGVTIWSATPLTTSEAGSLVTIDFHQTGLVAAGTTSIDLVGSVDPKGLGVIRTQVDDAEGPYTLLPAPTAAYNPQIDGLVSFGSAAAATGSARAAAAVETDLLTAIVPDSRHLPAHARGQGGTVAESTQAKDAVFAALAQSQDGTMSSKTTSRESNAWWLIYGQA